MYKSCNKIAKGDVGPIVSQPYAHMNLFPASHSQESAGVVFSYPQSIDHLDLPFLPFNHASTEYAFGFEEYPLPNKSIAHVR